METINPNDSIPSLNLQASLWRGAKIGLYGGTFNPIHHGHIELSELALKKLGLDFVFWLVSPGNPLKDNNKLPSLNKRISDIRETVTHPRIIVTDLESQLGTTYTADTVRMITGLASHSHFVWLMGADNMEQFDQWKNWHEIIHTLPIAVFDRPRYSIAALKSQMAGKYARYQVSEGRAKKLVTLRAPAWSFIKKPQNPANSTEIRNTYDPSVSGSS